MLEGVEYKFYACYCSTAMCNSKGKFCLYEKHVITMPLRKTPYFCRSGWKCKNGWTDSGVSDTTCPVGHQCYTFTYSQHERILGGLGNVRKGCTDLAFEDSPDHVVSKPKTDMVNECRSVVQTITSGQFAGRSHKYTACTCTGDNCNENGKCNFYRTKVFFAAFDDMISICRSQV